MLAFQSGDFCCQPASTFETTTTSTTTETTKTKTTTTTSIYFSAVVDGPKAAVVVNKLQNYSNTNCSSKNIKYSIKNYVVIIALLVSLQFVNNQIINYNNKSNNLQSTTSTRLLVVVYYQIAAYSNSCSSSSKLVTASSCHQSLQPSAASPTLAVPKENSVTIEVYRKTATTNPSTSRNYYLSRGGGGAGGGGSATGAALGTHSSGPTSAGGGNHSSNTMMKQHHHHQQQQQQQPPPPQSSTSSKLTMADRLNIGGEVRELKLGSTFNTKNTTTAFHTIKYDFKPASVDFNRVATVDIGSNNQVTVTVPNLESSGVPHTVYKGNHRKYAKECLVIFDRHTGVMTLEKLNHNIQVKKTRSEMTNKTLVPPPKLENSTMRITSKTKVSTGSKRNNYIGYVPRNSPMQQGSPSSTNTAVTHKSPQSAPAWNANNAQATLPSIPMIIDDDDDMGMGLTLPTGGPSSNANTSSSSSTSSHNNSGDFQMHHQPQQQKTKQSHQQQQQQKHHNNHPRQQMQHQRQPPQQHQQFQQQQNHQPNPSQQQYHNQVPVPANRLHHQPSNISPGFGGGNGIGHSNSNSFRPQSSSTAEQTATQSLDRDAEVLEREIGCLSSSESSSDSDSSDSGSDSDDSTDNIPQNNHQSSHLQTQQNIHQHAQPQPQQPPINSFSNGSYPALLHDDLQLSESNSSDSSDDDD